MTVVRSAQQRIEEHIVEFLTAHAVEDVTVDYLVSPVSHLFEAVCEHQEAQEHEEVPGVGFVSQVVWQVALVVTYPDGMLPVRLQFIVPFDLHSTDDWSTLDEALHELWGDQNFARVMVAGGMDSHLNEVAHGIATETDQDSPERDV